MGRLIIDRRINITITRKQRDALLSAIYTQIYVIERLNKKTEMKAELKLLNKLIKMLEV